MKNKRGFTLVELLAAIVILGVLASVGVMAIHSVVEKSKENYYKSQEKQMVMAAQSYINDNRNKLPKSIGSISSISLQTLYDSKYLKERIKDKNGIECYSKKHKVKDKSGKEIEVEGSRVVVFKSNKTDYKYVGYLECQACLKKDEDGELQPTCYKNLDESEPGAKITIPTINASTEGNDIKGDKKITMELFGLNPDNESIKEDDTVLISSYSYKIYVNKVLKKNSGIKINNKTNYLKLENEGLFNYVPGDVEVVLSVTNSNGITKTVSSIGYLDDAKAPACGMITYEGVYPMTNYNYATSTPGSCGSSGYPWLGIGDGGSSRQAWIVCNDKYGVGCAQHEFSANMTSDGVNEDVKIKDGKENYQNCSIRKCIDKTSPSITVQLLNGSSVKQTFTAGSQSSTSYYYKADTSGWLNKSSYPSGVTVKVTASDSISLINLFSWSQINTTGEEDNVEEGNIITDQSGVNRSSVSETSRIAADGIYELDIETEDYAGNRVEYKLTLKVDTTNPACSVGKYTNDCSPNGVNATLYCTDNMSGVNTCGSGSGGGQNGVEVGVSGLKTSKTYTVKDVAGNSETCSSNSIKTDGQMSTNMCSYGNRCEAAGVEEYAECTSSDCCGTHKEDYDCDAEGKNCKQRDVPNTCKNECCGVLRYNRNSKLCGCASWSNNFSWKYTPPETVSCGSLALNRECKLENRDVYRERSLECYRVPDTTVTVTFISNGSDSNPQPVSCTYNSKTASGCEITAPAVNRSGGSGYGWSKDPKSHTAEWKPPEGKKNDGKKMFSSNATYYAVSSKKIGPEFHYTNGTYNMNGHDSKPVRKTCTIYNTETSCKVETAKLIDFPDKAKSGCGDQYNKILKVKGWNTDKNATTGIASKTLFTFNEKDDYKKYYSIIVPVSKYVNNSSAFQVYAHSCNSYHHPNAFNRTAANSSSEYHFSDDSYIKEKAHFVWSGDWKVNSNYKQNNGIDYDDRPQNGYMYLIGKGTDCYKKCHSGAYIKAFQLKF